MELPQSLADLKLILIKRILAMKYEEPLYQLHAFMDELEDTSISEEHLQAIKRGMEDFENGRTITWEELKKKASKYDA